MWLWANDMIMHSITFLHDVKYLHAPVALFGHAVVHSIRLVILSIAGFHMVVEGLVISIKILESMVSTLPLLQLTQSTRISLPPQHRVPSWHLQFTSNEFVLQLIQTPPADPMLSVFHPLMNPSPNGQCSYFPGYHKSLFRYRCWCWFTCPSCWFCLAWLGWVWNTSPHHGPRSPASLTSNTKLPQSIYLPFC